MGHAYSGNDAETCQEVPLSNRIVIGSAVAVVGAMAFLLVAQPIMSAENLYDDAYARIDREEQCKSAQEAARAWAMLGPMGRMRFWRDRADTDCFSAAVYSR